MAEPWIRVHANIAGKPVVFRAIEQLAISKHEAIGLLVQFWGAVSQHAVSGVVGSFPDAQLEEWAGWSRKRGRFAAFVRAHHLDTDGRVNEWIDYAGKLEQRRATERDRLRNKRNGVAQQGAYRTQDERNLLTPARAVRNDTKRNSTTTPKTTTSRDTAAGGSNGAPEPPEPPRVTWLTPICTAWEAQSGAGSFASVAKQAAGALRPLVKAGHEPATIAAHLEVYLARTSPQFRSVTRFAQSFAEWAPTAGGGIVDGWMSPELERATRPQP